MRQKSLEQLRTVIDQALDERSIAAIDTDGSPSAQAYEGLRATIAEAAQTRRVHLAQLTELDRALRASTSIDGPKLLLEDMMETAGLERVEDPLRAELFDRVSDEAGMTVVVEPAYIDAGSGRVVRRGRLRPAPTDG